MSLSIHTSLDGIVFCFETENEGSEFWQYQAG